MRVRLPWSPDAGGAQYEAWARLATMMAGNNRGSWFIPDVDDEVLDGPRSLAWVQAQHKMFSAMAVMEWCGAGVQDEG